MNLIKMRNLLAILLTALAFTAFSQDINQLGEIYNEGNQALKNNDFELAIQKYEKSIEMGEKLGEEGEMIVMNSMAQLPSLYYRLGISDYKEKNIDKAIDELEKAIKFGKEYNDPETVIKSEDVIPQLYYARGNDLYKNAKFQEALISFKLASDLDPNYSRAFYGMGLTYNKMSDTKNMKEAFETAQNLAKAQNDDRVYNMVNNNAKKLLQAKGARKLQAEDWNGALMCLDASLTFDPENADTYYYMALASNGLKKWDDAIKAAQDGLDLSKDSNPEYKAKFYYEMGNGYKGKGQNSQACEAFKNAKHGRFVETAEYELITVLKCN
jgi:tetratricopeptide (TPR) repeat protein